MFKPILGRAGQGKTTYVLQKAGELALQGQKVMLIVPEQFSFDTERAVYRLVGAKAALNVEVYSFTRLCNKVFYTYGGIAGEYITDTAKQLMMALAVKELEDSLQVYASSRKNTSFSATLLETIEEFKNAGVAPLALEQYAARQESPAFSAKLDELARIYAIYQALLEVSYLDQKDDLMRGCKLLEGKGFFRGYTVLVDSFMTYMAGEFALLDFILEEAQDTYITFSCPNMEDDDKGMGVFSTSVQTLNRLIRTAKSKGTDVAVPLKLEGTGRFSSPVLAFLEWAYPQNVPQTYQKPQKDVHLVGCEDPYEEILFVAATISRLVQEEGYRYKDFAVIGRTLERHQGALEDIFERYSLPVFMDLREDILAVPVVTAVCAALDAVCTSFDTANLLTLAKSTIINLSALEISQLENYCYLWSVKGASWKKPFANNPKGLSSTFSEEDKALLAEINGTRQRLIDPLLTLKEQLEHCSGTGFAQGVYTYLTTVHTTENLTQVLEQQEDLAGKYRKLCIGAYEQIVGILETFAQVIGEVHLPLVRYTELFRLALQSCDLGSIPNTLDQVVVGMADRIRPNNPKVTFIIGANAGLFPGQVSQGGIFTDAERQSLIEGGLEISPPSLKKSLFEAYYAYFALTTPSARLYVCWHNALLNGEAAQPSAIVDKLSAIFVLPTHATVPWEQDSFATNPKTIFDTACRLLRQDTPLTASLIAVAEEGTYRERLHKVIATLHKKPFVIQDHKQAKELFGTELRLSPSRIEDYQKCPFSFFCNLGLRLRPRNKVQFSPLESGTVIHYVMEKIIANNTAAGLCKLTEEQVRAQVEQLLQEYLAEQLPNQEEISARLKYLFARLVYSLTRLALQLAKEFLQSAFVPIAFEMDVAQSEKVTPIRLTCVDGTKVEIIGKIDRVDLMENAGGEKYIRVVDYKSGEKTFRLSDVYYGLNLQMLVYLFTLWQNGKEELQDCLPAGVLYMPSGDKLITAPRQSPAEEVEQERSKKYRMNGLILEDITVIRGMEEEAAGVFIPASVTAKGEISAKSSVANLAQMGKLKRHIEGIVSEIGQNLTTGQIDAVPVTGMNYEPCQYCPYHDICGHEQEDRWRNLVALSKEEMYQKILREGEEDA